MSRDSKKKAAALAAIEAVESGAFLGVGTGSTTDHFIDALAAIRERIAGAVASSTRSAERLRRAGIPLVELAVAGRLPVYVDGADEATRQGELIKGGGGALTREKVIAAASDRFVCIIDDGKLVDRLGRFPLPVEVVPMASDHVAREIESLGGRPALREGFVTDNDNVILDVIGLDLTEARRMEQRLNQIAGVVTNGLFCRRGADELLVGGERGVTRLAPG